MKDISFKTYQNEILTESTAENLFNNKKVLVCSIVKTMGKGVANLYLKHLFDVKKKYKDLGIDEIFVVNSSEQIWLLPKILAFFPGLIPLLDHEQKFIRHLEKEHKSSKNDFDNLPYQALITNGVIEKIYISLPTNFVSYDFYKKVLYYIKDNLSKISTINLKKYRNLRQEILIQGINHYILSLKHKDQAYYDYRDLEYAFDRAFFYYDVWPNTSLEEHLEKQKKANF